MENNQLYNDYITDTLRAARRRVDPNHRRDGARERSPAMNVSATEGKLLQVLALMVGARRVLEIGTLGGYSGIHFARALPDDGQVGDARTRSASCQLSRAATFERAGVDCQNRDSRRTRPPIRCAQLSAGETPNRSTWFSWTPTKKTTSNTSNCRYRCCAKAA